MTNPSDNQQREREAFEAWAKKVCLPKAGSPESQAAWSAWKAARLQVDDEQIRVLRRRLWALQTGNNPNTGDWDILASDAIAVAQAARRAPVAASPAQEPPISFEKWFHGATLKLSDPRMIAAAAWHARDSEVASEYIRGREAQAAAAEEQRKATGFASPPAAPLEKCGYCGAWQSKPCGEGCQW